MADLGVDDLSLPSPLETALGFILEGVRIHQLTIEEAILEAAAQLSVLYPELTAQQAELVCRRAASDALQDER